MDCCGDVDCCEESEVCGDKMDHTSRGTYLVQCIIFKPGWDLGWGVLGRLFNKLLEDLDLQDNSESEFHVYAHPLEIAYDISEKRKQCNVRIMTNNIYLPNHAVGVPLTTQISE